jgi:hypothetical protein
LLPFCTTRLGRPSSRATHSALFCHRSIATNGSTAILANGTASRHLETGLARPPSEPHFQDRFEMTLWCQRLRDGDDFALFRRDLVRWSLLNGHLGPLVVSAYCRRIRLQLSCGAALDFIEWFKAKGYGRHVKDIDVYFEESGLDCLDSATWSFALHLAIETFRSVETCQAYLDTADRVVFLSLISHLGFWPVQLLRIGKHTSIFASVCRSLRSSSTQACKTSQVYEAWHSSSLSSTLQAVQTAARHRLPWQTSPNYPSIFITIIPTVLSRSCAHSLPSSVSRSFMTSWSK